MAMVRNPNKVYEIDPDYKPTHKQLIKRVGNYLRNSVRMTVVFEELSTTQNENPDVMSWSHSSYSIMVEVKVSRADFHADKKKPFRRHEELGVGDKRYFAVPKGLIQPNEVPKDWGLLYVEKHCVREIVKPKLKEANKHAECTMLISAIRRLQISTAVFVMPIVNSVEGITPHKPNRGEVR